MGEYEGRDKAGRILRIYDRLIAGDVVNKVKAADEFGVNPRSIQRDIDEIRENLSDRAASGGGISDVRYDRKERGFKLTKSEGDFLGNAEMFAVIKTILDSRSLSKKEATAICEKLLKRCLPYSDRNIMRELIGNELFNYVEPRHHKDLADVIWKLGNCIHNCQILKLKYKKTNGEITAALVKPLGIMCSEYYFYLIAYVGDADIKHTGYPTVYRVDRIEGFEDTGKHFHIPYKDRFEEGEFRKRIPFMFTGKLMKKSFVYKGPDIDAVLDRLPTAKATRREDGSWDVTVEVYGELGLEMWMRSQGEYVGFIND